MMKKLVLIFLLVLSTSLFAKRGDPYTFINAGLTYAKLTSQSDTINEIDPHSGMHFAYGKKLSKNFLVEVSYSQNSFKESVPDGSLLPSTFKSELQLTEIMLGYRVMLGPYWALKMGYNYATFKRSFTEDGLNQAQVNLFTFDQTYHTFYVGLATSIKLVGGVRLFFEAIYSSSATYNKNAANIGLEIRY